MATRSVIDGEPSRQVRAIIQPRVMTSTRSFQNGTSTFRSEFEHLDVLCHSFNSTFDDRGHLFF